MGKRSIKWVSRLFKFHANTPFPPSFAFYNWSSIIELVLLIKFLNFDHNAFFWTHVNFHSFSLPTVVELGLKTTISRKKTIILAESLKKQFLCSFAKMLLYWSNLVTMLNSPKIPNHLQHITIQWLSKDINWKQISVAKPHDFIHYKASLIKVILIQVLIIRNMLRTVLDSIKRDLSEIMEITGKYIWFLMNVWSMQQVKNFKKAHYFQNF